jgi:hypothetical protein
MIKIDPEEPRLWKVVLSPDFSTATVYDNMNEPILEDFALERRMLSDEHEEGEWVQGHEPVAGTICGV